LKFKGGLVVVYAIILVLLVILLNTTVLVTLGHVENKNGTDVVVCGAFYEYGYFFFDLFGRVILGVLFYYLNL
jgi:hypothetical protein